MAHGRGAADLSGASGRVAAEVGLLQSGRGSGSAVVAADLSGQSASRAAVRQRQCRGGRGSGTGSGSAAEAVFILCQDITDDS